MNPGAVLSQLLSWSVAASPMRSAVGSAVLDVGVDLFLADLFGNRLLIRDRLSTETDPLDRNRFLLHNGPLLAADRNRLRDILGHNVLSQSRPAGFLGPGADVESLL